MRVDLLLSPKTKRPAGEQCCEPVVYPEVERDHAGRIALIAKALGDPVRLQLVARGAEHGVSVRGRPGQDRGPHRVDDLRRALGL